MFYSCQDNNAFRQRDMEIAGHCISSLNITKHSPTLSLYHLWIYMFVKTIIVLSHECWLLRYVQISLEFSHGYSYGRVPLIRANRIAPLPMHSNMHIIFLLVFEIEIIVAPWLWWPTYISYSLKSCHLFQEIDFWSLKLFWR